MPSSVAEILTFRQFILAYFLRYKNRWLLGFLFVLLTNVWQVGTPWVLRYAVEYLEYQLGGLSSVRLPSWLLRWASMFSLQHFLMLCRLQLLSLQSSDLRICANRNCFLRIFLDRCKLAITA